MTWFDYAVLAIVAISVLLGLWRGVVSEILALLAWAAAFFAAVMTGRDTGKLLAAWITDPWLATAAGYATVFVAVLVAFALGRYIIARLLRAAGLGWADRLLGGVFGVARGALVVLVAVLIGGMTPLPKEPWWHEATLAPPLETAVLAAKPWLPPELTKRVRYR